MPAIRLINSRSRTHSDILVTAPPERSAPSNPIPPMSFILLTLRVAIRIILVIALADFVAGGIHWAEDAYFTEETPVIGPLFIRPNIVHHHHPRFFTHLTWWQSSWDLALV